MSKIKEEKDGLGRARFNSQLTFFLGFLLSIRFLLSRMMVPCVLTHILVCWLLQSFLLSLCSIATQKIQEFEAGFF